jgi:putative chitinase
MDAETLSRAAGIPLVRANMWARPLTVAMDRYDISSPVRQASYIAECGHESAGFLMTREVWGPTRAQLGYEGRADLGNTRKGDGSLFRGRGLIMATGRANYAAIGRELGVDLLANPALLEREDYAALSSAFWWKSNGCNALADRGDFLALSIRINGKNKDGLPKGWADRQRRWVIAKRELGVQ